MSLTVAQALTASHLDVIDARALLRHALGVDDAYLIANSSLVLTEDQSALFGALAARRTVGEPVAYITGLREFFSLEFKVTPAVLIPRPETELLAEVALEHIVVGGTSEVLDLGTGSGCIAITVASLRPGARAGGGARKRASAGSEKSGSHAKRLVQRTRRAAIQPDRVQSTIRRRRGSASHARRPALRTAFGFGGGR